MSNKEINNLAVVEWNVITYKSDEGFIGMYCDDPTDEENEQGEGDNIVGDRPKDRD